MKKFRLSDHIMPRRMVRHFLWLIPESIVLYVLFKITAVVWRSIALASGSLQWLVLLILAAVMGAFPALWEAVQLSRDSTIRMDFMASVSDGSYNKKEDLRLIVRADEPWNDTVVLLVMYLILYAYRMYRVWFLYMTNPDLTNAQVNAAVSAAGWMNFFYLLVLVAAYAAAHIWFTVIIHNRWNGERLRAAEAPTAEKMAYM
ncbi:MAG: hypothetical protein IJ302_05805 [Clostridia bacterium]|nr:hypothetical protein [Clostridia bacterium]